MAIAARTATKGTATSGGAFTITFPTGSAAGDVVVLFVANAGTAGPAAPAGWTRYRNADSAGTGQSLTTFTAPWSAGLTANFTNAASVAAWTCNSYSGGNSTVMTDGVGAATSSTTNNTTLPTGAPTTGSVAGDYEVLGYAFTSAATVSTPATGSTIDATQANSTSVSAVLGHNNTTSLGASTATTAFSQTLSASNTRKTGVGVLIAALDPTAPAPTALAMTISGSTPIVVTPIQASPTAPAATLTGSAPAIAKTANVLASPTPGSLTAAGATPAVTAPAVSLPSSLALSLSAGTPAVATPVVTLPAGVAVTTTGATPAVAAPRVSLPSGASLTAAGATPAIIAPVAVSPAAAAVTSLGATPAVATPIALNPAALALALAYGTPAVVTPSAISPSTASLALTASAPSVAVSGGEAILVTPAALALALAGAVPYVGRHVAGGGIHGFPYIPHAYMVRQDQIEADQRAAAAEHLAQQAAEQAEFDRIKAAAAAHLRALHADDELLLLT